MFSTITLNDWADVIYNDNIYKPRCTLFMVLYPCRMCQCGLHDVLGSRMGMLMRLLDTEPRITAGLFFPSQCLCGTIFVAQYSMVWDLRVFIAGPPMIFYWFSARSVLVFQCFPVLFYLSIGWYCGAEVFGLRGCKSLSLSQPCIVDIFGNNNNNKKKNNNNKNKKILSHK